MLSGTRLEQTETRGISGSLLTAILRDPGLARHLQGPQWSEIYRQARSTGLMGRLAATLLDDQAAQVKRDLIPEPFVAHLEAAARVTRTQLLEVQREARHIDRALAKLGAPVILLKGAAYAVAELPASKGRVFSDVDILVPKEFLPKAESLLTMSGWLTAEESAYNQHYYREWMHELPPMCHIQRGTTLDVHHTILPETARLKPDAGKLIASAVALPGTQVLHVFSPVDRVLHSMTHLFLNEDMGQAVRDLSDLDLLLRDPATGDEIWGSIVARAQELQLQRPLFYGLKYLPLIMQTPVPQVVTEATKHWGPAFGSAPLMDWIWRRALALPTDQNPGPSKRLAESLLYLRGHWLRMPFPLLARHLTIKALGLHKNDAARSTEAKGAAAHKAVRPDAPT